MVTVVTVGTAVLAIPAPRLSIPVVLVVQVVLVAPHLAPVRQVMVVTVVMAETLPPLSSPGRFLPLQAALEVTADLPSLAPQVMAAMVVTVVALQPLQSLAQLLGVQAGSVATVA